MKKLIVNFAVIAVLAAPFAMALPAMAATPNWTLHAPGVITFTCGGLYAHTLDAVTQDTNGNLIGTGHYNADSSYTWNLTGNITGNAITFAITYMGTGLGTVYNGVGTIASDGSISGTTDSNCQSFSMSAGSATLIPVPSVVTDAASPLAQTIATLNGTNGPVAAGNTSFWWGTTPAGPFAAGDNVADFAALSGWNHDSGLGAASAGGSFSEALTGLTPGGEYYFAAWSEIGGIWYPGAVLNFTTAPTPPPLAITKDQCMNNSWKTLVDSVGHSFKNQGDCVSFVATGGKNLGAGSK